jgi:hypothetical protein
LVTPDDSHLPADEGQDGDRTDGEATGDEGEDKMDEGDDAEKSTSTEPCDFLKHDEYLHEGCKTFERILDEYSSYAIWKWIKKGYCDDFEERWEYLGMDKMSCQQIEQVYESLEVKQEL